MTMQIALIAALDRKGVIGHGNRVPWYLPADLRYFKAVTMGKPLIMGRKTYESIGRPLPGRHNIVLTRRRHYQAPGCTVVHSLQQAVENAADHIDEDASEVMIIGGAEIFRQFLPCADRLYLTYVLAQFEGDTFFPEFDEKQWHTVAEEAHEPDKRNQYAYRFTVLERQGEKKPCSS